MKNFHKISTVILLVLAGVVVGYFLIMSNVLGESTQEPNMSEETVNNTLKIEEEVIETNETNETKEEIPKIYNNPPVNKEDYINLLGEIDYSESYELFFDTDLNDSAVNYSKDPLDDVIDLLDAFFFWEDEDLYHVDNYWATPNESLKSRMGDDEDFALLALALHDNFRDKNQSCYLIGNEDFTGLFCFYPNYKKSYGEMVVKSYTAYAIYSDNWWQSAGDVWASHLSLDIDEGFTENLVRKELRIFIKDFMMNSVGYCCTDYPKNDMGIDYDGRKSLKFLYNKNEFYELETTEDLEDWIYERVKDKIFG